jgi:hypothetical protein
MTLGNAAAARVRLIVRCLSFGEPYGFGGCRNCRYQVEPAAAPLRAAEGGSSADPAEMARRYGPETTVIDWSKRFFCSRADLFVGPFLAIVREPEDAVTRRVSRRGEIPISGRDEE